MAQQAANKGIAQSRLGERQLDLIVRQIERLPVLPEIAGRLMELLGQSDAADVSVRQAAREQAVKLACMDVGLAAALISQANRICEPCVATPQQAIEKIGFEAFRSAVFSSQMSENSASGAEGGLNRLEFWKHSLAVGLAARTIAEEIGLPIDGDEVFLCGLLHDIGKLAMDAALPKSYARVLQADQTYSGSIAEYEQEIIGTDHCIFGRRLAEHWRLGKALESVIWLHHQAADAIPDKIPDRKLVLVVALADCIARRQHIGFSGNFTYTMCDKEGAQWIGLSEPTLKSLCHDLSQQVQAMVEDILGSSNQEQKNVRQVPAQTNVELSMRTAQLSAQVAQLAGQAGAFETLNQLSQTLAGEDSVADVVLRIAQTAQRSLDLPASEDQPVLAYCIDFSGGDSTVLFVRFVRGAEPLWRTLVSTASADSLTAPKMAEGARQGLSLFLREGDDLGEWADLSSYIHQPLRCAGQWVGGLLHPSLRGPEACDEAAWQAILSFLAMATSLVQERSHAMSLSEQLASASRVLAETHEALAEAKTLSAVGEMAAGAAHELNNPLAVISGRAQLMRDRVSAPEDRKLWQNIADQAQRISDIISELMEFASPAAPVPVALDVAAVLEFAKNEFVSSEHPQAKTALVDIEIEDTAPKAWADAAQVRAVIGELIRNAATMGAKRICLSGRADEMNRSVLLAVEDDGPGMDEQTMARAFTPFFSNQRAGRRRGMGLARAKRFVEINGGRIRVRSRVGMGTKVFVLLPVAET